jgi:mono/diheme cytochrome c family protein
VVSDDIRRPDEGAAFCATADAGEEAIMCTRIVLLLVVFWLSLFVLARAQQKEIKHVSVEPTSPASGAEMYKAYCAVCHGMDGKGVGPAAEALRVPPPNLTTLAQNNAGKYPSDRVSRAIQGDLNLPARGSKEMPVWGYVFWRMSQGHQSEVQLRVSNLNKYIERLQVK